jgi:hypothetical protein
VRSRARRARRSLRAPTRSRINSDADACRSGTVASSGGTWVRPIELARASITVTSSHETPAGQHALRLLCTRAPVVHNLLQLACVIKSERVKPRS